MADKKQNRPADSWRAHRGPPSGEENRPLVVLDSRTITRQGHSRVLALPKQGLSNLGLGPGDELDCSLDAERGELVLRPRGREDE